MPRGRNSKSCVLKDNARERKQHESDAAALDDAVSVIERRFSGEETLVEQLEFLAAMIRQGDVDFVDHIAR